MQFCIFPVVHYINFMFSTWFISFIFKAHFWNCKNSILSQQKVTEGCQTILVLSSYIWHGFLKSVSGKNQIFYLIILSHIPLRTADIQHFLHHNTREGRFLWVVKEKESLESGKTAISQHDQVCHIQNYSQTSHF